jgi:hypothetical protein
MLLVPGKGKTDCEKEVGIAAMHGNAISHSADAD